MPGNYQPRRFLSIYDFDIANPEIDLPALAPQLADARDAGRQRADRQLCAWPCRHEAGRMVSCSDRAPQLLSGRPVCHGRADDRRSGLHHRRFRGARCTISARSAAPSSGWAVSPVQGVCRSIPTGPDPLLFCEKQANAVNPVTEFCEYLVSRCIFSHGIMQGPSAPAVAA